MWPSMPDSVNSGTNPAMMMAAAKKIDWLTSAAATEIVPVLPRKPLRTRIRCKVLGACPEVPRGLGQGPIDFFDHDHRRIHDQAEVDRAHGQEIRRFAAQHHEP